MKPLSDALAETEAALDELDTNLDAWVAQTRQAEAARDAHAAALAAARTATDAWLAAAAAGSPDTDALGEAAVAAGLTSTRLLQQAIALTTEPAPSSRRCLRCHDMLPLTNDGFCMACPEAGEAGQLVAA